MACCFSARLAWDKLGRWIRLLRFGAARALSKADWHIVQPIVIWVGAVQKEVVAHFSLVLFRGRQFELVQRQSSLGRTRDMSLTAVTWLLSWDWLFDRMALGAIGILWNSLSSIWNSLRCFTVVSALSEWWPAWSGYLCGLLLAIWCMFVSDNIHLNQKCLPALLLSWLHCYDEGSGLSLDFLDYLLGCSSTMVHVCRGCIHRNQNSTCQHCCRCVRVRAQTVQQCCWAFFRFLVLIDSGMVGVFWFVFSVVWKVGKQSHNQKYVKISASNPAKMYHDV